MHEGLRVTVSHGRGDGQLRVAYAVNQDGAWVDLAVRAETKDEASVARVPAMVADVVALWLKAGAVQLLLIQEADLP